MKVIENQHTIIASKTDLIVFIKNILYPPKPNKNLRDAAKKYILAITKT